MLISPVKYHVISSVLLSSHVMQIKLKPKQATNYFHHQAGQYAMILLGEIELPYSIANAPQENGDLEFYIRQHNDDKNVCDLLHHIKTQQTITISRIAGNCCLPKDKNPLMCLAGGTGFAPMKAILGEMIQTQDKRSVTLYWAVNTKKGCYLHKDLEDIHNKLHNLQSFILMKPRKDDGFNHKDHENHENHENHNDKLSHDNHNHHNKRLSFDTKNISVKYGSIDDILQDLLSTIPLQQLIKYQVIAAGPYAMVAALWKVFHEKNFPKERFHNDMLTDVE